MSNSYSKNTKQLTEFIMNNHIYESVQTKDGVFKASNYYKFQLINKKPFEIYTNLGSSKEECNNFDKNIYIDKNYNLIIEEYYKSFDNYTLLTFNKFVNTFLRVLRDIERRDQFKQLSTLKLRKIKRERKRRYMEKIKKFKLMKERQGRIVEKMEEWVDEDNSE